MRSFFTLFLIPAVTACIYSRSNTEENWNYEGATGPVMWHSLSDLNSLCAQGTQQSPINIHPGIEIANNTHLHYPSHGQFNVTNNGHTIEGEVEDKKNYTATLGGEKWALKAFHFHSPSEHRINGRSYPLEAHFVHRHLKTGAIAVFAVFFEVSNHQGSSFFHRIPVEKLTHVDDTAVVEMKLRQIVAHSLTTTVFTYTGSLTTPPCSENVTWFVAEDALSISVAQYRELKNVVGFNSRFTQGEIGDKNILAQECALGEL